MTQVLLVLYRNETEPSSIQEREKKVSSHTYLYHLKSRSPSLHAPSPSDRRKPPCFLALISRAPFPFTHNPRAILVIISGQSSQTDHTPAFDLSLSASRLFCARIHIRKCYTTRERHLFVSIQQKIGVYT